MWVEWCLSALGWPLIAVRVHSPGHVARLPTHPLSQHIRMGFVSAIRWSSFPSMARLHARSRVNRRMRGMPFTSSRKSSATAFNAWVSIRSNRVCTRTSSPTRPSASWTTKTKPRERKEDTTVAGASLHTCMFGDSIRCIAPHMHVW